SVSESNSLRSSAAAGLVWGVGFTLARDVVQFLSMLVLARLLSPAIYGQAALAQTIIAFVAVASIKTLAQYPMQARDPLHFSWDAHFTAGALLNLAAFVITNCVSLVLLLAGGAFAATGTVVMFLSLTFILEIACTYYTTWLDAH